MLVTRSRVERDAQLSTLDPLWARIRDEAQAASLAEPALSAFLLDSILSHNTLEEATGHRVASRLDHEAVGAHIIAHAFDEAVSDQPEIGDALRADISAVLDRDPASHRALEPVLYFKGFHALQSHRLAHWLWSKGRVDFALYLQSRGSSVFGVDIHPAASIGRGIMFDHATGIVVGETAVIGDNVSILHGVTLGGNGKADGDRHPKVGSGVLIGAGAKILGESADRRLLEGCGGLGRAARRAGGLDRCGRAGEGRRQGRLQRAGAIHEPSHRRPAARRLTAAIDRT